LHKAPFATRESAPGSAGGFHARCADRHLPQRSANSDKGKSAKIKVAGSGTAENDTAQTSDMISVEKSGRTNTGNRDVASSLLKPQPTNGTNSPDGVSKTSNDRPLFIAR
jgi:hypothetical protein